MANMAVLLMLSALAQPAAPAEWPLESITLVNGATLRGLALEETAAGVRFRVVRRPAGRPMVTLTSFFPTQEVKRVSRLPDSERAILQTRLKDFDSVTLGQRQRAADLLLKPAAWLGQKDAARQYDGELFVLISNADEDFVRRAALRLEQIFTAFARYLPPRVENAAPVTILIAARRVEFALLVPGRTIANPAIHDPAANRIVIGSDLRVLGGELAAARLHHVQQLTTIADYERHIGELYKTAPAAERVRHLKAATDEKAKVHAADRDNDRKFDEATAQLFALLFHEAFHAHVTNSVYPPRTVEDVKAGRGPGELPRWLNEGLAQIFETAFLDGAELRVGHADAARLTRAQTVVRSNRAEGLMGMAGLLVAGPEAFVAAHSSQKETTDAVYLASWAAAHHVMFERRLLATPQFHDYLQQVNGGADPRGSFEKLVGMDLIKYEAELRAYLLKLQPDGSVRK
jgi:hypothetical protein